MLQGGDGGRKYATTLYCVWTDSPVHSSTTEGTSGWGNDITCERKRGAFAAGGFGLLLSVFRALENSTVIKSVF